MLVTKSPRQFKKAGEFYLFSNLGNSFNVFHVVQQAVGYYAAAGALAVALQVVALLPVVALPLVVVSLLVVAFRVWEHLPAGLPLLLLLYGLHVKPDD